MIKLIRHLVGLSAALVWGSAFALVPLEGLLQGTAKEDLQYDPMSLIFRPAIQIAGQDRALLKLYTAHTKEAQVLKESCDYLGKSSYPSVDDEERARRSVVATLQYIGIDASVKAIGLYAKSLQMPQADYEKMVDSLLVSSCTPNLSVYGLKLIHQNLLASYTRTTQDLPTFPAMPFVAERLTEKMNSRASKELELHQTLQNFRALCSWGGDTGNYRLLPPLLSNPLVMAAVIRHLENRTLVWKENEKAVQSMTGGGAVQVICKNLICRRVENNQFLKEFPRLIGSSGLRQDLNRLWCGHFSDQSILQNDKQHPQVREWLKKIEPGQERQMVAQMVALFTGVPDLMVGSAQYSELRDDLRAGVEERWDQWAKKALSSFSRDLFFEESLEIKVRPQRDPAAIRQKSFAVDLQVSLGELDRVIQERDKLRLDLSLKLSRNWLRWVRSQWNVVNQKGDSAAMETFIDQIAAYLWPQLEEKTKYFPTPLYGEGLQHLIAQELLEQVLRYQGPLFDTLEEKMISVPVQFHYGMFALSYMRYKAQIKGQFTP